MTLLAQVLTPNQTLAYLLPLVASISLVYAATRYESWPKILYQALKASLIILILMAVILGIIAGFQFDTRIAYAVIIGGLLVLILTLPKRQK